MALNVTLSRGPRADQTTPVLATGDRRVVHAVLDTLARLDDGDGDHEAASPPIGDIEVEEPTDVDPRLA